MIGSRNTPATKTQTGPKTGTMLRGAKIRNVGTNC